MVSPSNHCEQKLVPAAKGSADDCNGRHISDSCTPFQLKWLQNLT